MKLIFKNPEKISAKLKALPPESQKKVIRAAAAIIAKRAQKLAQAIQTSRVTSRQTNNNTPSSEECPAMQALHKSEAYPDSIKGMIVQSGQAGIGLANRWMLGWPQRVELLLGSGEYRDAFMYQLEQEHEALATSANNSHLSPTEIFQVHGLTLAPPGS